jgi:uncharacterized protein YggU (UPF0235/DUF167 family)
MYVKVRVKAGARKEVVEVESVDHFTLAVKEKAKRNTANLRVIYIIAKHFSVPASKVRIINGHHSPLKLLSVDSES